MNVTEAKALWLYIAECWPHYRLPETKLERETREMVWTDLLGDLDATAIRAVIAQMAHEGREFAPSPGQLREAADRVLMSARGSTAPDPDVAWAEVKAMLRRGGADHPSWSHPAIAAAVDGLGWRDLRNSDAEAEGTWRAHFMRFYEAARTRQLREIGHGPAPIVAELAEALGGARVAHVPREELTP